MSAVASAPPRALELGAVATSLVLAVVTLDMDASSAGMTIALAVALLVVWITWQDLKSFTISDAALLALGSLAVASRWETARGAGQAAPLTALTIALDALVPGGCLFLFREVYFRRKGHDGLGFGDVKLAAVGGILVGAVDFSWALFAASLVGLCAIGIGRLSGRPFDRTDKFAFGAVLAPALWLVWITGQVPALSALVGP